MAMSGALVPPTPSAAAAAAACRDLMRLCPPAATPLAVMFPRSAKGVAVIPACSRYCKTPVRAGQVEKWYLTSHSCAESCVS